MGLMCISWKDERTVWKIPTTKLTPTPEDIKIKCQSLLTDIEGEWYVNKIFNTKPTTKNPQLIKKEKEK